MERVHHSRLLALAGSVLLAAGVFTPARAQDPDDQQRAVARISLMNGEVSVRRGDSGEWVAGVINAPLLADDRISTGPNSRAEVQLDSANMLRMGGNAEVRLTSLEYGRYQMEIARGTVTYRVLRPSSANVEADTPNVSVRPSKQGTYRITVNDAGESEITARAGDVEVFTPRGSQWVYAGQTMLARGSSSDPEFQVASAIPYDDWDRWSDSRDRALTQSASARYVPPGVNGAEDLDSYGTWTDNPQYGNVWRPAVPLGWAPYQAGRWVWLDWYGWTWVSYDPWGWAPYHYGRWFWDAGWCWYPGAFGVRHFWSPALVGFFGFGHGVGFGFGFGRVGWVPLAPFEVFHPWWGRGFYGGRSFERNVNITNVNITNNFRNARALNGVSAVSAEDFRGGRFNNIQRVSGAQVGEAGLIRGRVPITPTSANLRFSDRAAANVPRSSENTRFFTHQQPSQVQRVPFAQQQRAMEQGSRAAQAPARGAAAPAPGGFRGAQGQSNAAPRGGENGASGGFRRFGESPAQNTTPRANDRPPAATQAPAQRGGGWNRFGAPGGNQAPPRSVERQAPPQSNGGFNRFGSPGSSNNAPRQQYSPPPRSESRSNPGGSPPRSSAPSYSAPRSSGGGGGGGARSSGGGGHASGGGSSRGGHK